MDLAWQIAPPDDATPEEGPGSFRRHEIQPFGGGMKPCSWVLVPAEIGTWLASVNGLRDCGNYPVKYVAQTHAHFERIHPFLDGNGRTGRLIMNLVLVRLGMPPAIIYKRDRDNYLTGLKRADGGDVGVLSELIARAVLNNLNRLMLPARAGPARLVPIAALLTAEITHGALRSAAARGVLKAQQDGLGQWQSSQVCVEQDLAQRNTRRGRPKGT